MGAPVSPNSWRSGKYQPPDIGCLAWRRGAATYGVTSVRRIYEHLLRRRARMRTISQDGYAPAWEIHRSPERASTPALERVRGTGAGFSQMPGHIVWRNPAPYRRSRRPRWQSKHQAGSPNTSGGSLSPAPRLRARGHFYSTCLASYHRTEKSIGRLYRRLMFDRMYGWVT